MGRTALPTRRDGERAMLTLPTWATTKLFKIGAPAALLVLLLSVGYCSYQGSLDEAREEGVTTGAQGERLGQNKETLENVKKANDATRVSDDARAERLRDQNDRNRRSSDDE